MYRAICLLLALWLPPSLAACCNFDRDSLAQEAAKYPGLLDLIAGKVDRLPATWYQNELAALAGVTDPAKAGDSLLRRADALLHLGRYQASLAALDMAAAARLSDQQLQQAEQLRLQAALLDWFQNPSAGPDQLKSVPAPKDHFSALVLEWARTTPPVHADEMLPDFFALRIAPFKTAIEDNDQLDNMKLRGVADFLVGLIRQDPAWETVDVFYALSLALGVEGKQNLAQYARLRVFDLLAQGATTRLDLPAQLADLKPLLYPRHLKAGALAEIVSLTDDQKAICAADFAARRKYALAWQQARSEYAVAGIAQGQSPLEADFWRDFAGPEFVAPAVTPAKADPVQAAPAAVASAPVHEDLPAGPTSEPSGGRPGPLLWLAALGAAAAVAFVAALGRRLIKPRAATGK